MRKLTAIALAAASLLTLGAGAAFAAAPARQGHDRSVDRASTHHEHSQAERAHRDLERTRR